VRLKDVKTYSGCTYSTLKEAYFQSINLAVIYVSGVQDIVGLRLLVYSKTLLVQVLTMFILGKQSNNLMICDLNLAIGIAYNS